MSRFVGVQFLQVKLNDGVIDYCCHCTQGGEGGGDYCCNTDAGTRTIKACFCVTHTLKGDHCGFIHNLQTLLECGAVLCMAKGNAPEKRPINGHVNPL